MVWCHQDGNGPDQQIPRIQEKAGKVKYDPKSRHFINTPQGYQKVKVHLVFARKHDGFHKAWLVAVGNLTPDPIDSI